MLKEAVFSAELLLCTERLFQRLDIPIVEKIKGTWDNGEAAGFLAIIELKGALQGHVKIFVEISLAYLLVKQYILEAVNEEEIPSYADKVTAEIANIIAGSALSEQEDCEIYLGTPSVSLVAGEVGYMNGIENGNQLMLQTEAGIFQCWFTGRDA